MHPTIFHTGSIAEYHDSWLCILSSQYLLYIDCDTKFDEDLVIDDSTCFESIFQKYEHFVTNLFVLKREI